MCFVLFLNHVSESLGGWGINFRYFLAEKKTVMRFLLPVWSPENAFPLGSPWSTSTARIWPLTESPVSGAVLRVPLAPSVQEPVGPWRRLQVGRRTAKPIPEGMMLLITSTAEEAEGTGWPAWTHPSEGYRSKWTRNVSRNASHPQQALLGSLSVLWGSREVRSVHQKACICLYTLHTVFKFLWVLMSTSMASRF